MSAEHLREQNLRKAIFGYEQALKVIKRDSSRMEYSEIRFLMGNAYARLAEVRDKETNLKLAINACKEALTIFTEDSYPETYKIVIYNLKNAQSQLTKN
jgi:tetratricopeptide (TPR) repeat protein